MAPVFQSLGKWAVLGLALASNIQATSIPPRSSQPDEYATATGASKVPLRLMPLGASITMGHLSTDGNGYRKDLFDLLTHDGFQVDMVGSRHDGTMADNEDEGWSGFRISQVEDKAKLSVPGFQPNIFTLNAGTNDCAQNFQISTAGQRMEQLINYLWGASPNSTVILSTLIINLDAQIEARVEDVNSQFKALYQRLASQDKRIVFADMHTAAGPQRGDMADGTHPNDVGYDKMAKIWHTAILAASASGMIRPPLH